ncbi:MAG: DUF3015 domain-containing protein [Caulobacterales bacterium]|nr:DUF3015 domain-containing protein [Caulobacterales bacterium]
MLGRLASALVIASATITFASAPTMAQTRDTPNPWLDCGIGAMIFPDDNVEAAAGISNIIWDLGTTAVTSAQSSPDTCNGTSNVRSAMFIQRTYGSLELEIAKGEGEHLKALSELMGCDADHRDDFIRQVRVDMADTFAAPGFAAKNHNEKAEAFYWTAADVATAKFAGQCVLS